MLRHGKSRAVEFQTQSVVWPHQLLVAFGVGGADLHGLGAQFGDRRQQLRLPCCACSRRRAALPLFLDDAAIVV